MNLLPKDLIISFGLRWDLTTVLNLSLCNKIYKGKLLDNDLFWMKRLEQDYGEYGHQVRLIKDKRGNLSWKQYYEIIHKGTTQDGFEAPMEYLCYSGIQKMYFEMCDEGNIDGVRILLNDDRVDHWADKYSIEHTADPGFTCRTEYNYGLLVACKNGHFDIVKFLLNEPQLVGGNVYTPCFLEACKNGHIDIVKILLDNKMIPSLHFQYAISLTQRYGFPKTGNLIQTYINDR